MKHKLSRLVAVTLLLITFAGLLAGCDGKTREQGGGGKDPTPTKFYMTATKTQQDVLIGETVTYELLTIPMSAGETLYGNLSVTIPIIGFSGVSLIDEDKKEMISSAGGASQLEVDFPLRGDGIHRYQLEIQLAAQDSLIDQELAVNLAFTPSDGSTDKVIVVQAGAATIEGAPEEGTQSGNEDAFQEFEYKEAYNDRSVKISTAAVVTSLPMLGNGNFFIYSEKVENLSDIAIGNATYRFDVIDILGIHKLPMAAIADYNVTRPNLNSLDGYAPKIDPHEISIYYQVVELPQGTNEETVVHAQFLAPYLSNTVVQLPQFKYVNGDYIPVVNE